VLLSSSDTPICYVTKINWKQPRNYRPKLTVSQKISVNCALHYWVRNCQPIGAQKIQKWQYVCYLHPYRFSVSSHDSSLPWASLYDRPKLFTTTGYFRLIGVHVEYNRVEKQWRKATGSERKARVFATFTWQFVCLTVKRTCVLVLQAITENPSTISRKCCRLQAYMRSSKTNRSVSIKLGHKFR